MQPFTPGQVWTYHTRPEEEASRVVICQVDEDPKLGPIVHIHVTGVRFKNQYAPRGFSDEIGHMPYSADALRVSLVTLESTNAALPRYEDGYQEWRSAFEKGEAGVWTLSLRDAIASVESLLNR